MSKFGCACLLRFTQPHPVQHHPRLPAAHPLVTAEIHYSRSNCWFPRASSLRAVPSNPIRTSPARARLLDSESQLAPYAAASQAVTQASAASHGCLIPLVASVQEGGALLHRLAFARIIVARRPPQTRVGLPGAR